MCGAALSYWEATLKVEEVNAMANVILDAGQSDKLSAGQWSSVIGIFTLSALFGVALGLRAFDQYQRSQDAYHFVVNIGVVSVYTIFWPAMYYVLLKLARRWSYREANSIRPLSFEERRSTITSYIRRWSFYSLYLAGVCQIPLLLFSKD
jgi:hypothetical protein